MLRPNKRNMDIDNLDEMFRLMESIMNNQFSGGYSINERFDDKEEDSMDPFEITDDKKHIYITVELRGLTEDDINVKVHPWNVVIEMFIKGQWYYEELSLPCEVKTRGKISFNNYILDIILKKCNTKRKKYERKKGSGDSEGNLICTRGRKQ